MEINFITSPKNLNLWEYFVYQLKRQKSDYNGFLTKKNIFKYGECKGHVFWH